MPRKAKLFPAQKESAHQKGHTSTNLSGLIKRNEKDGPDAGPTPTRHASVRNLFYYTTDKPP